MARDRQRRRRSQRSGGRPSNNPGPRPSEPHRDNVPGELDHASGGVDEFEAALVAGADGVPAEPDAEALEPVADEPVGLDGDEPDDVEALDDEEFAELEDEVDEELDDEDEDDAPVRARRPREAGPRGPAFIRFLRNCWAELQRVQWPDRRQVAQATAVVLGFVVIAGAYLGLADEVAKQFVDLIL